MSDKENIMEFEGTVDNLIKDKAFVKVSDTYTVVCTVSGKIRQSAIRILPGDRVKIEVSAYDTSKGRITYRLK